MKRIFVCFLLIALTGCDVHYRSVTIPDTESGLAAFIASEEAEIAGIELELAEAKESRDKIAKAAESANGWYAQSEYSNKLSDANRHVEFAVRRLTQVKSELSSAQQKLKSLENKDK